MDIVDIARYLGALLLVLSLVGFAALAARRYGLPGIAIGSTARRLAVVETLMLDTRHKAFLLRRDDREHLVVVGPEGTSVVETGIAASSSDAAMLETRTPHAPTAGAAAPVLPPAVSRLLAPILSLVNGGA